MKYKVAALMTMVCVIGAFMFSLTAMAAQEATLSIPVSVISDQKQSMDQNFTIKIEGEKGWNPMPASQTLTLKCGEKKCFPDIVYTEPGEYHYKIYEESIKEQLWQTDQRVYHLGVRVIYDENQLKPMMWLKTDKDEKITELTFVNHLNAPKPPETTPAKPNVPDRLGKVKTYADAKKILLFGMLLTCIGVMIISYYSYLHMSNKRLYANFNYDAGHVVHSRTDYKVPEMDDNPDPFEGANLKINWSDFEGTDVVAWLQLDDISYPVLKGDNNAYYLNHAYNGESNMLGSIFMDCNNRSDLSDQHTVIYGHRTMDGQMFGCLERYMEPVYQNHCFYIYTPDDVIHRYDFFSIMLTQDSSYAYKYQFPGDYKDYLKWMKDNSLYQMNSKVVPEQTVVTLSTCAAQGSEDGMRLILQGIASGTRKIEL